MRGFRLFGEEEGSLAGGADLDGNWIDILRADDDANPEMLARGDAYRSTDLDSIVNQYQGRKQGEKAPLSIGFPDEHQNALGVVDAVRRKGNVLQARFSGVNPDLAHLYRRGIFTKKVASAKRTPEGISLQRVGLLKPGGISWKSGRGTPSLEAMTREATSTQDHVFGEVERSSPDYSNGWIEIFQAGAYPGKGTYSAEDIDRVIRNFDPSFHEPPVVIGHPEENAPAYGWVSGLKRDGGKLLAQLSQVDPSFASTMRAGRFKKRSASFYTEGGKISSLRHVGFLGAQPPEVKGLRDVSFDDRGRGFMEIEEETMVAATGKTARRAASPYVQQLKAEGRWLAMFDEHGFPDMFAFLEAGRGTHEFREGGNRRDVPLAECLAWLCAGLFPTLESIDLDRQATRLARTKNIGFGEALTLANEQRAQTQRDAMMFSDAAFGPGFKPVFVVPNPSLTGDAAAAQEKARLKSANAIVDRKTGGRGVTWTGRLLNSTATRYAQNKNIPFIDAMNRVEEVVRPRAAAIVREKKIPYDDAIETVLTDPLFQMPD